jgi:predicted membrane protein (TIGR00267 family)
MRLHIAQLEELRGYFEIAEIGEIARRYAAMNAFDGILTIMGVLMGSYTAHVRDPRIVISTGLATAVAIGVSGLWGAYLTETAERKRSLDELEQSTLSDLSNTRLGRASRVAVITVALVDGLAPFLAALVVLLPFFLALQPSLCSLLRGPAELYYVALGTGLGALFAVGVFVGSISRDRLLIAGAKTVAAGLTCMAINLLLGAD